MTRSIQTLSILVALLTVQGNLLDCLAQDAASVEAAQMLDRGDSLLQLGKPVAALSMYRGAEERSFDPSLIARARMGIAEVHVESHNPICIRFANVRPIANCAETQHIDGPTLMRTL